MSSILLSVENLYLDLYFQKKTLPVLQDISFQIQTGETLSLVGESGCGKTVCSMSLTKLLPKGNTNYKSGKIVYKGNNILELPNEQLRQIRGKEISYIFQDPFTSLNPLKRIKDQIIESYLIHISPNKQEAIDKAKFLLNKVGITDLDERLEAYPNQMSGGMLQRIAIAMALMCNPSLLVADEPTSALDVTVQAQLVELLMSLKEELKMSILFITHDLSLVGSIADKIAVMYAGQIVEMGSVGEVIDTPKHPYTKALLESVPSNFDPEKHAKLKTIEGIVPTPDAYPTGCHFSTRCEFVFDKCNLEKPNLRSSNNHFFRCFLEETNR